MHRINDVSGKTGSSNGPYQVLMDAANVCRDVYGYYVAAWFHLHDLFDVNMVDRLP